MEDNGIDVSIIILTKNAEKNIHNTISMILNQETKYKFEAIIIDSGSEDKTIEIVKGFPDVKLIQNKPEEFQHGRTRNLGGKTAKGKYLVFLNGDAIPRDRFWLDSLLKNFEVDETIVGVYSRHLPKENCHFYIATEILNGMRPIKELRKSSYLLDDDFKWNLFRLIHFSTVSCAIKKEIWEIFPFCEDLPLGEDQDWSKRVLETGYSIVYEPTSVVFHSHNRSLIEIFRHYYNCALVFNSIFKLKKSIAHFLGRILILFYYILVEIVYIIKYAQSKNYNCYRVLKEIVIAVFSRSSGTLGEICGDIKSLYKPIRKR